MKNTESRSTERTSVREEVTYTGFLNLLLFCGAVFVFGFISMPLKQEASELVKSSVASEDLVTLKGQLESEYAPITDLSDFSVHLSGSTLEIHFGIADLFMAGGSELSAQQDDVVAGLAKFILPKVEGQFIEVQGHSDDARMVKSSGKFPTNWELSTARASRVLRVLIQNGHAPTRLTASGRSWYAPKAPNRNVAGEPIPENRLRNRRLVLRIGKR